MVEYIPRKTHWAVLLAVVWLIMPDLVSAKIFKVNNSYDINDLSPGDGNCVSLILVSPPYVTIFCTLRGAVEEANKLPGPDEIELPYGVIRLSIEGKEEEEGVTGDLDIRESVTIRGKGTGMTVIDGSSLDRVFDIHDSNTVVILKDLSLINSFIPENGGIVRNGGNLQFENVILMMDDTDESQTYGKGGLLFNSGDFTARSTSFHRGKGYEGGGIYNSPEGNVRIYSSTVSSNSAVHGAGIYNSGWMQLENTTISTNGDDQTLQGGGVFNADALSFRHVTVAHNISQNGGGVFNRGIAYLESTMVAENSGQDCYNNAYHISYGYNLDSDNSCLLDHADDKPGEIPGLKPLDNYGGQTMVHDLYPYSSARDGGGASVVSVDQRGVVRPVNKRYDIGSVEFSGFPFPSTFSPLLLQD